MSSKTLKAGALFSGIGGFCLGFEQAGIKTVWAIENNSHAVETYKKNIHGVRIVEDESGNPASVTDVTVSTHKLEPVDVLHAGFPCQSFSQAGERRGFDDPRGQLFFEIIRIIEEFKDKKPAVIVLENSPHIRHGEGGSWFLEITKQLKKAGYWFRETNSAELDPYILTSLPQKRNRLSNFLILKNLLLFLRATQKMAMNYYVLWNRQGMMTSKLTYCPEMSKSKVKKR